MTAIAAIMSGFLFGFALGPFVAIGLAIGFAGSTDVSTRDPRRIVWDDLIAGLGVMLLMFVLSSGSILSAGASLTSLKEGVAISVGFGYMLGLPFAVAFAAGIAGLRYLGLLLCTRRGRLWLPWRLGRFLDVCYRAGLVRIAGNGYQFRHSELQEFLARKFRIEA
jgi:hypothetical protein